MGTLRKHWSAAAIATVALLAATACGSSSGSSAATKDAATELRGMVSNPPRDVSTLALPDAANGDIELPMKAPPGELLVVFFGYTNCPDICPGTMAGLRLARHELGKDAKKINVAFVTVDPQRDTGEVLNEYIAHFFDKFHALRTDDPILLQTVADGFGVQYELATDEDGEPLVGHTSLAFAVDDQGQIVDAWPFGMDERDIANDMKILLNSQ